MYISRSRVAHINENRLFHLFQFVVNTCCINDLYSRRVVCGIGVIHSTRRFIYNMSEVHNINTDHILLHFILIDHQCLLLTILTPLFLLQLTMKRSVSRTKLLLKLTSPETNALSLEAVVEAVVVAVVAALLLDLCQPTLFPLGTTNIDTITNFT